MLGMTDEEMSVFEFAEDDITPEEANRRLAQNAREHVARDEGNAQQASRHVYSHYSFAEACKTAKPKEYLISGHVQAKALHMTYGEPASGKTFLVLDQAATIACDEIDTWQGRHVKHGQVVYFAGEASSGVKLRCAGWATERGINPENVQMVIFDEVFNLDDDNDTEHQINNTIANIEACAPHVVYIIIDTLHAFMSGDENLAKDSKKMQDVCRKLIRKFDCAVNLIHHVGVSQDAKGRARGSSSWKGAMDIETLVQQEASNEAGITCRITQKKHKDGKKCKPFTLKMNEVVLLGMFDDEGRPVTTLVAEINETTTYIPDNIQAQDKTPKLSTKEKYARDTYKEAAIRHGKISVDYTTGDSFIDVEIEQWRAVCYELSTADTEKKKRNEFDYIRKKLTTESMNTILTKRTVDGRDYYRLSHNGEKEATFRAEIFAAVIKRDEEMKKSVKENNQSAADDAGIPFRNSNCLVAHITDC